MKGRIKLDRAVAAAIGTLAILGAADTARAQIYWDINGATAGATDDAGGVATGTWDALSLNWTTDATGGSATQAYVADSNVVFSAGTNATGASTITIAGTQTAAGITFKDGVVTIAGDELDLVSPATLQVDAATARIDSVLGGTAGLNKTGTGVLTLGGVNTNTGLHTVTAGTLRLAAADRIADAADLTVGASGTFDLNGFNETVRTLNGAGNISLGAGTLTVTPNALSLFSGTISGTGGLTKNSSSTLQLTGNNTYSGVTQINAGSLAITSNNSLGDGSATNTVTFNGGTIRIDAGGINFARAITMTGAGTVNTNGNDATLSSVLTGNGNFTKSGDGRLTLTGNSPAFGPGGTTAGGRITVSGGTLVIPDNAPANVLGIAGVVGSTATQESNTTVNNGATIEITGTYNGADQLFLTGDGVSGGGALRKVGNNITTIAGKGITINGATTGARITATAGELVLSNSSAGRNSTTGPPPLIFDGAGNIRTTPSTEVGNFNIAIGNSRVIKEGTGKLTLGGSSSYTGGTIINAGTVSFSADVTGNGSQQLGSTPDLGANDLDPDNIILNGGTLESTNTATMSANNNRGLQVGDNGGTVRTANSFITIWQAPIGIAAGATNAVLTKTGPGEFRYNASATNTLALTTYTKLVVNEGLFRLGFVSGADNTEIGFGVTPSSPTADAITLSNQGAIGTSFEVTFNANRGVTLGTGGGVLNMTGGGMDVNSVITGTGPLRVAGSANNGLMLLGANTYSGQTIIGGDINMIGGIGNGTTSAEVTINSDASFGSVPASPTANSILLGAGTAGDGTGSNGLIGVIENLTLDANRGILINVGNPAPPTGFGKQGGNIAVAPDKTAVINGAISGVGALNKVVVTQGTNIATGNGTGTLILAGDNTYTGSTIVDVGRLQATKPTAFPGRLVAGSIVANSGGTLAVNAGGTGEWAAADIDTLRSNATLNAGSFFGFDTTNATGGSFTYSSAMGGAQGIVKLGAGTLVLGAANTYTGGTNVAAGALIAANADATGGGSVNVADGALAQAQAGLPKAVTVTTLATNTSGKFDLTDNSMVVKGMTAPQVQTLLQSGYNAGHWDGATGIVSSTAAASTETSVGYASNGSLNLTEFKGVTGLVAGDVLVKYTYAGDANLDGKVDIGDLGLLAGAWQQSGKVWFDGDFTYNGTVDIGDLGLLAGNWQKGVGSGQLLESFDQAMAQFSAFDGVAVPEPTGLALLGLAGAGLLARRRRPS
jgi:autotransporter-associated beta strand protein